MAHDIKIYGEIVPFQDKWITDSGGFVNLSMVQEQLKEANGEDIRVRIKSYGGDVEEGFAIYSELRRYAKDNNAKVTTLAEGQCASIATVFFLAGDERLVTEFTQPFVHNAWTYVEGDSKLLQRVSVDLDKCNDMIANHYANHTDLTKEEARELMDNETSITPEECVRLRFATSIEEVYRPTAMLQILNKSNRNVMSTKKVSGKKTDKEKSFLNKIKQFFDKEVFTAENDILDFYELEDNETVKVGDKAKLGDEDANGEVIIANGDIYVFSDGELIEIKEKEAENPEANKNEGEGEEGETIESLKEEIKSLKDRIAELEAELDEAEDIAEKANAKMEKQNSIIANLKEANSKYAPDQRRENKKDNGEGKSKLSDVISQFKNNKLKTK